MLTFFLHPVIDGKCACSKPDCDDAGKHPAELWSQAPLDREELQPTATQGVGIITGKKSGIFVVDLDLKDDKDGLAELEKLAGHHGGVPPTFTVATPTGGFHLYFRHPGFPVRNSGPKSNPLAPGIDVRGDGGYVVAPGSPHKNGGRYEVARDLPIAEAPAWLLAWPGLRTSDSLELAAPAEEAEALVSHIPKDWRVSKAKAWLATQEPAVEGQGGDPHTFQVLTRAVHDYCLTDQEMINEALLEWNARCSPPWTGAKWQHKVKSALENSTKPWSNTLSLTYRAEQLGADLSARIDKKAEALRGLGFEYGAWDSEPPPTEFLVEGLIPRGSVGMFFGRADALKTWLLFSLGLAIAEGKPWLGHFGVKPSKVGIVDFETGKVNVDRRLYMLRAGTCGQLGRKAFPNLKPNDLEFWAALVDEGFDLVIIDSLRKANPGANENDSDESIIPLNLAAVFSEKTDCAVYFIHHAKRDSSDGWPEFRGSGAIEDQVDCAFAVRKTDISAESKNVEIRCEKPGDMRKPEPFAVDVTFNDISREVKLQRAEPKKVEEAEETNEQILMRIMRAHPSGAPKQDVLNMLKGRNEIRRAFVSSQLLAGSIVEFKADKGTVYLIKRP